MTMEVATTSTGIVIAQLSEFISADRTSDGCTNTSS